MIGEKRIFSVNKKLFIYAAILLFIHQSSGYLIKSNSGYYILFLFLTFLSYLTFKKSVTLFLKVSYDLLPIYFYFFFFLISSIWSSYPFQAIYFIINDSIYLVASILFALIYHQFTIKGIIYFFQFVAYFSLVIFVSIITLASDFTTLGNSSSVLFAIFPYLFISDQKNIIYKYFPIICSLIVMLLSVSRAPLGAALISGTIVLFITRKGIIDLLKTLLYYLTYALVIVAGLSFIPYVKQVFILFIFKFFGFDFGYTSRVLVYQEDYVRTSIFNEALNLYSNYWFQGMGYMNFMKWYGENIGASELSANGDLAGMNLHNSFQTWALEGGLFLVIIVVYIMSAYIKRGIYKIKFSQDRLEKNFHIVGLVNILSFAIFASFHQLHQTFIFFILLGIVLKRKNIIKSNSLEV